MTACLLCEDKSHFCQPAVAKGNRKKRNVSSLEGPQWTILVQDDVCSTVFPHGVSWGYLSENIDMYHPGFHDRIDNDIPACSTNNQLSSAHSVVDWIDEGILIHTSSHPGFRLQWRDNANNVPKLIWKKETETRSGGKGKKENLGSVNHTWNLKHPLKTGCLRVTGMNLHLWLRLCIKITGGNRWRWFPSDTKIHQGEEKRSFSTSPKGTKLKKMAA